MTRLTRKQHPNAGKKDKGEKKYGAMVQQVGGTRGGRWSNTQYWMMIMYSCEPLLSSSLHFLPISPQNNGRYICQLVPSTHQCTFVQAFISPVRTNWRGLWDVTVVTSTWAGVRKQFFGAGGANRANSLPAHSMAVVAAFGASTLSKYAVITALFALADAWAISSWRSKNGEGPRKISLFNLKWNVSVLSF